MVLKSGTNVLLFFDMTKFFRKKIVKYDIFFVTYGKTRIDHKTSSRSARTFSEGSASVGRLRRSHSGACTGRLHHHPPGARLPLVAFAIAMRGVTPAASPFPRWRRRKITLYVHFFANFLAYIKIKQYLCAV